MDALADPDSVPITFQVSGNAPFTRVMRPLPLEERREPYEAWRDLSPASTGNRDRRAWVHVLPPVGLPVYLRRPNQACSYEYLEADRLLYIQLTRNASDETCSQEAFATAVEALADSIAPTSVAFDVRFNTGGNFEETAKITKGIPGWFRTAAISTSTGPWSCPSSDICRGTIPCWRRSLEAVGENPGRRPERRVVRSGAPPCSPRPVDAPS